MQPVRLETEQRPHYPRTCDIYRTAGCARLSDVADFAATRFYGHLLRRPDGDDARFMLRALIPGMRGRQRLAVRKCSERMHELASAAGLSEEDAATRTRWRRKNKTRLAAAQSDAATIAAVGHGAPAAGGGAAALGD